MNTTVMIQKTIRDRAVKRAKRDHISLSTIVGILLNDYAAGRLNIGTKLNEEDEFKIEKVEFIEVNDEIQGLMDDTMDQWDSYEEKHLVK